MRSVAQMGLQRQNISCANGTEKQISFICIHGINSEYQQ